MKIVSFMVYVINVKRKMDNSYKNGLTSSQVEALKKEGKYNKQDKVKGKSHLRIVFESFFTFFNIVLYVVSVIFAIFQACYPDGLKFIPITKHGFLLTILCNATISIVSQEISKHTLEKMRVLSNPKAKVIRDGKLEEILIQDIVLGDSLQLKGGDDIPCDLILKEGELLVNESMLTGESKPIKKVVGDKLFSGSFVISGKGILIVEKVGKDRYISTLQNKVSAIKKKKSNLLENINRIIKILIFVLIPLALCVGFKTYYIGTSNQVDGKHFVFTLEVLTKASATIVGMIPIGMILLSSITLSKSIIDLGKKNTMVQELYAIENLSRVNILCLDKTGTLTTQNFQFDSFVEFSKLDENYIYSHLNILDDDNKTSLALKAKYNKGTLLKSNKKEEFSSITKSSKVYYENGDYSILGAPDFIFKDEKYIKKAKEYSLKGYRVLGFSINDKPVGLFLLKDELRNGIKDTLSYFDSLDIKIKIISGDDPLTVSCVSKDAGVLNYDKYISMENVKLEEIESICEKYTIFGRTNPDQKQEIIRCLQLKGNRVGYVGDGVNDVTPLRQADCSIGLKSGADSTKAVADVVLLDDDFNHLPEVFKHGRRVVTNIQRSMLLFLTKSFFVGLYSFISLFLPNGLPIELEAIYIYEFVTIAFCGFLLSIQNTIPKQSEDNFAKKVLKQAFGLGLFMAICGLIPLIINYIYPLPNYKSLIVIYVTIAGLLILYKVCYPFNKYTTCVSIIGTIASLLLGLGLPDVFLNPGFFRKSGSVKEQFSLLFKDIFNMHLFTLFTSVEWICIGVFVIVSPFLFYGLLKLKDFLVPKIEKIKIQKK